MSKARDLANGATALSAVSATELGYVDGVTSAIQTQMDTKLASATAATTYKALTNDFTAGKNAIINGGFDIWQRGTTGVGATGAGTGFVADRWQSFRGSYTAGMTVSQQSPGSTLSQFRYCIRGQRDSGNTSTASIVFSQQIETSNAILYAGQSITLSYYARAGATFSGTTADRSIYWGTGIDQNGSTGGYTGSTQVTLTGVSNPALSTSWQRYIFTGTIGSTATQMYLSLLYYPTGTAGATDYIEYAGVQLELGSTATAFSRAGGTIQGELAACQRYYLRVAGGSAYYPLTSSGFSVSTTQFYGIVSFPVQMRVAPSALEQTGTAANYGVNEAGSGFACNIVPTFSNATVNMATTAFGFASGLTTGRGGFGRNDNNTAAYLGWSAEL
jgi:hypothetical protein